MPCKAPRQLDIDSYIVGELGPEATRSLLTHMERCEVCNNHLESLRAQKSEFLGRHPYHSFAGIQTDEPLPWFTRLLQPLMLPALRPMVAIILIAFILVPVYYLNKESVSDNIPNIAYKGASAISFLCRRQGTVYQGDALTNFMSGDEIQLLITLNTPSHVSVLSIDQQGIVSFYDPEPAGTLCSVKMPEGQNQPFASSVILDQTPGGELIITLISDLPMAREPVKDWVLNALKQSGSLQHLAGSLKKHPYPQSLTLTQLLNKD